jgi:hypothetical protein
MSATRRFSFYGQQFDSLKDVIHFGGCSVVPFGFQSARQPNSLRMHFSM